MELNNLKPAKGSTHHDKRVGRGAGSGHGAGNCSVFMADVADLLACLVEEFHGEGRFRE